MEPSICVVIVINHGLFGSDFYIADAASTVG
jgi:hypothetical protein